MGFQHTQVQLRHDEHQQSQVLSLSPREKILDVCCNYAYAMYAVQKAFIPV